MRQILPAFISFIFAVGAWFFFSYVMYRIGKKFQTGSFLEYCIPIYNIVLMCRCGDISPLNILGLFIPIVNIYFTIHIWGSIAQRLGKNYWIYGAGSFLFYITVFIMAFDSSGPKGYVLANEEEDQNQYSGSMLSENNNLKEEEKTDKTETKREKNVKSVKAGFLSNMDILGKIGLKTINELIGVDIGSSSIKLCILKKVNNSFQIQNIVKKTYEEDLLSDGNIIDHVFIAEELKKVIQENNIRCKDAACALSSYTIITKKILVPFLEEEDLENTIKVEVETVIPFPLKDIYYSYYVFGIDEEKEDMMNVQIVAAKKEIVDSYTAAFLLAGLNLQILDVDIFGITNIIEEAYDPKDFSVIAVDIGSSITNIAILKGYSLEFTREILIGGKYLTGQIEKSTRLSHWEAEEKKIAADNDVLYLFEDFIFNISSEITKTINFYTATKPNEIIGKIYLTGGSSLLHGLKEKIGEDTGIEVEYINPFLLVNQDKSKHRNYEEYSSFAGVALYLSSRVADLG